MARRVFTPEEANKTLPLVRRIVADVVSAHREIQRLHAEYHQRSSRLPERAAMSKADREALEIRVQEQVGQLQGFRAELKSIGCILKDEEKGLLDFPGKIEGRDVWLCWMLGEDTVGFWHELDAGFTGRQPLPRTVTDSGTSTSTSTRSALDAPPASPHVPDTTRRDPDAARRDP
ncbi:MAG: DUF2203 domain-containing protein [Planctomycetes bacterium]|nr:DUF2203 domain-containing protein [Planctomycetota bacterium]MBI3846263.1 DUF2203 domain-containing protein [Planctomycetota bacterium]